MAFEGDDLVLLDWAMPTAAPGALDIARFIAGCSSVLEPSREEVLAAYARAAGPAYDERSMRLALLAGPRLARLEQGAGRGRAPRPAVRERERQDLDWWVREARTTLESGVI